MAKTTKIRIDKLLVDRGLIPTRAKAQAYIMAGDVRVNGEVVSKVGTKVAYSAEVDVTRPLPYVSRGGYKLAGALDTFGIDLTGRVCADVGACTGGFSDVMLQRGAAHVYAIDVGYGQLAWKIRQDDRVTVMERTNARHLEALAQPVNFVSIDVSFISLRLILPAVQQWLQPDFDILALIKPQFEAGRSQVGKGGIVRDVAVHRSVLTEIMDWCTLNQLMPSGLVRSSITGADGNVEFLVWLRPHSSPYFDVAGTVDSVIDAV